MIFLTAISETDAGSKDYFFSMQSLFAKVASVVRSIVTSILAFYGYHGDSVGILDPMGGISNPVGGVSDPMGGILNPVGGLKPHGRHFEGVSYPMGGVRRLRPHGRRLRPHERHLKP